MSVVHRPFPRRMLGPMVGFGEEMNSQNCGRDRGCVVEYAGYSQDQVVQLDQLSGELPQPALSKQAGVKSS